MGQLLGPAWFPEAWFPQLRLQAALLAVVPGPLVQRHRNPWSPPFPGDVPVTQARLRERPWLWPDTGLSLVARAQPKAPAVRNGGWSWRGPGSPAS